MEVVVGSVSVTESKVELACELHQQKGTPAEAVLTFLHGIDTDVQNSLVFKKIAKTLAPHKVACLGVELPNHGRSTDFSGQPLPAAKGAPRGVLPSDPQHLLAIMREAMQALLTGQARELPKLPKRVIFCGHSLGGLLSVLLSEDEKLLRALKAADVTLEGLLLLAPAVDTDSPLSALAPVIGGPRRAPGNCCSMAHPAHWPVRQLMKLVVACGGGPALLPPESPENYLQYGMVRDSEEYKTLAKTYQVEHIELGGLLPLLALMRILQTRHWKEAPGMPELPMMILCAESDSAVPRAAIEAFAEARGLLKYPGEDAAMHSKLRYLLRVPHAPHQCLMGGIQPPPPAGKDWTQDVSLPSIGRWVNALLNP
eukprot:TRINITY_DN101593_c0_g1_i1.p1 TRINITY_DN101593_c0_g1~~TRINITY_DN101593_c0_g1_i1.p1  ORF type:complete len:369 (+),score=64.91 TRINITY_DN101593_c0_g1_i1:79-1185(+)